MRIWFGSEDVARTRLAALTPLAAQLLVQST
jgi:hypothetical protein